MEFGPRTFENFRQAYSAYLVNTALESKVCRYPCCGDIGLSVASNDSNTFSRPVTINVFSEWSDRYHAGLTNDHENLAHALIVMQIFHGLTPY